MSLSTVPFIHFFTSFWPESIFKSSVAIVTVAVACQLPEANNRLCFLPADFQSIHTSDELLLGRLILHRTSLSQLTSYCRGHFLYTQRGSMWKTHFSWMHSVLHCAKYLLTSTHNINDQLCRCHFRGQGTEMSWHWKTICPSAGLLVWYLGDRFVVKPWYVAWASQHGC